MERRKEEREERGGTERRMEKGREGGGKMKKEGQRQRGKRVTFPLKSSGGFDLEIQNKEAVFKS